MEAKGFSTHFSSAIAITAASLILGCAINADSKATLEIHSPPLFYKVFCTVFNFHISIGIDGANITCFKPTIVSKVFLIIRFKIGIDS
jgi:hypothetical protein